MLILFPIQNERHCCDLRGLLLIKMQVYFFSGKDDEGDNDKLLFGKK
jgi:hypothetical protein